eukprot:UN01969
MLLAINKRWLKDDEQTRMKRVIEKLKFRIQGKTLHPEAKEIFEEGLAKLEEVKTPSVDSEITKSYLEWLSHMPWGTKTKDNYDIKRAQEILDEDHFGMKDVKERILEQVAKGSLKDDGLSSIGKILCLVGPPGVGKTSIGSSVAKALDRKFYRFSLGGSSDTHELKGFLRTYVGSQPGKIIHGLKLTQSENPVVMIDEVDKIGARFSNPSHVLLEILDPSQNKEFTDSYLDVPVDLSNVLFILTANDSSQIHPALADRLHIIQLDGYDAIEKNKIARKYLIPKAISKSGILESQIDITDDGLNELTKYYCRESGVRSLEQHMEKICDKVAYKVKVEIP